MKIVDKSILYDGPAGPRVIRMEIVAPDIAKKAKAGQFVVIMASERGERIPLTIVDKEERSGTISIIFQEAGFTTRLLGNLGQGQSLFALIGPLGCATEIKKYGRVLVVGGGVGIAEVYPVAKAMKDASNHVTMVLGAKNKGLLILEQESRSVADEFYAMTDDGSYGAKGYTTDAVENLLKKQKYDLLYCVGPIPMMRKLSSIAKGFGTKTVVSLNAIMVDATGMCGCCRVTVGGAVKFSCVDGPEFDAHEVDWDELSKRNDIYRDKEAHICKLEGR